MIKILSTLQIKGYFLSFIKRIYPKKQLLIGSHKLRRKQKRILWKRTVKGDVYSWGFEQAEEEAWGSFLAPIPLLAIGAMPSLWGWGAEMRQGDTAVPLTPTPSTSSTQCALHSSPHLPHCCVIYLLASHLLEWVAGGFAVLLTTVSAPHSGCVLIFVEWMDPFRPLWSFRLYRGQEHWERRSQGGDGKGNSHPATVGIFSDRGAPYHGGLPSPPPADPPTLQGDDCRAPQSLAGSPVARTSHPSSASAALPEPGVVPWAKRTIWADGLENSIVWTFSFNSKIVWFHSGLSL